MSVAVGPIFSVDDDGLLLACRGPRAGEALGELARRHADFVFGVARRRVGDPHLAADVTQAVFMILSRKAVGVRSAAQLPAWLLTTTRLAAANALRQSARRARHERAAAALRPESAPASGGGPLAEVEQHLDEALARLPEAEREAILLRFFRDQDYAQVAAALSVNEATARKRVSRGVERLREELGRLAPGRAAGATAAAATAVLVAAAAEKAPAAVAADAAAAAVAPAVATPAAAMIAKASLAVAATGVSSTVAGAVAIGAAIALIGGVTYLAYFVWPPARGAETPRSAEPAVDPRPPAAAPVAPPAVAQGNATYAHTFADGTRCELVLIGDPQTNEWWRPDGTRVDRPPFSAERADAFVDRVRPPAGPRGKFICFVTVTTGPDGRPWTRGQYLGGRQCGYQTIEGDDGVSYRLDVQEVDATAHRLPERMWYASAPQGPVVRIAADAAGRWPPAASDRRDVTGVGMFTIASPREVEGRARFDWWFAPPPSEPRPIGRSSAFWIAALDPQGRPARTDSEQVRQPNGRTEVTLRSPLSAFGAFAIELVVYDRWVEFSDVPLRPGAAGDVKVSAQEGEGAIGH